MSAPIKPLRILAIVNLPWDPRLGAARVWIELAEEWKRAGYVVEIFCLTNAFPAPTSSGVISKIRQARFPFRAARHVRRHADRFDVIDCLLGTLPFTKRSLSFRGLFVARSVGLYWLYERFMRESRARWSQQGKGKFIGRVFHRLIDRHFRKSAEASLRVCDLLNVPNEGEREALQNDLALSTPVLVQPYGLSDNFREAFARAAAPAEKRLRGQKICFIGMWSLRKGSRDWPKIMRAIWQRHPAAEFVFLGTMLNEKVVRAELALDDARNITCLPTYATDDLPSLLADAALALFPSYIEGFGLAVLEQLAAGLPTIAYDVPGPREILQPEAKRLLTPSGDPAAMAERAAEILALSLPDYEALSAACRQIAAQYRWSEIASATIESYRAALDSLGKKE
ncbi:MAG TPA: glycosyltransferase family 4 protein [Chthoniobacterales bacterium]|nr:glycosyltransferase family 4 protein [Chthoniobacterales bacterium]